MNQLNKVVKTSRIQFNQQKHQTQSKTQPNTNIKQISHNLKNQLIHSHNQLSNKTNEEKLTQNNQNISHTNKIKSQSIKQKPSPINSISEFTLSNNYSLKNMFHQNIVQQYFQPLKDKTKINYSNTTAVKYSQIIQSNIVQKLYNGTLKISNKTHKIKHLLDQSKLSTEQLKLLQIKAQTQIKSKKLQLLDPFQQLTIDKLKTQQQDQNEQLQIFSMISNSVLSKQQHKKLIEKFRSSNKKNQQNRKQRLFEIQERQRSLSYEKQQAQQQKRKRQKQLKRLSIQKKLTQRKQQHQKFLQQQRNSTEKYKQVKKKTFLHQNLQQKYKSQILIPILEQKKMKLKQLRDFYKRYDISEIKKHQLQYLQKQSKSTEKNSSRTKVSTFHYNPPQKSKKLSQLLQQENHRAKIKFQETKRILQENKLKQLNFLSEIKLKFKPKVDQHKKEEIQQRIQTSKAQIKHKYSQRDLKQLGMRYFQEAKTKIKKNHDKQKTQGNDIQQKDNIKQKPIRRNKQKTQGNYKNFQQDQQNEFIPVGEVRKMKTQRDEKKINISSSMNQNHRIKINESKRKRNSQDNKLLKS